MAMLAFDEIATATPAPEPASVGELREKGASEEDIARWIAALPLHRRVFARFYRALRKLQPAFPPMSCC